MSESQVLKQAQETHNAIHRAYSQLYVDSTEIRHELERITDPLLQWVYDARHFFGQYAKTNPECKTLYQRLQEIEGVIVGRDDVQINYNVEREMDHRVSAALAPTMNAVATLRTTAQADPLVTADTDSSTAPMMDLLREVAKGLGAR